MPRKFIIGRERESDIAIADDSVSRKHAEIWLEDNGTIMLADRGSSNGTQLIRAGVAAPVTTSALLPGDQVRFGAVSLSLQELVDAIELKNPGALTPAQLQAPPLQPPPLHAPAPLPPPPVPQQHAAPPPMQQQHAAPPPMPPQAAPPAMPPPIGAAAPVPPPVPPPVQRAVPPAIPPGLPPVPPAIPPAAQPPALHPAAPPPPLPPAMPPPAPYRAPGAALVRCECGAIKTHGEPCPTCHR